MAEACLAEIRAMMSKEQEGVELPKCVFDLRARLAAATERVKQTEIVLAAWHKTFGTTQLSHAIARLEKAERDAARAQPTPESK